jgi:hypothetical protein
LLAAVRALTRPCRSPPVCSRPTTGPREERLRRVGAWPSGMRRRSGACPKSPMTPAFGHPGV